MPSKILSSLVLIFLAAVFCFLSFPNEFFLFGLWPLGWVFAVPFLIALHDKSWGWRILLGLMFGGIFYALLIGWFISYSKIGFVVFWLALMVQPVLFSLFYCQPKHQKLKMIYAPSLWVASEFIRTLLMGGFSWNLAHSQAFNLPVIQSASIFGSFFVSFVMMGSNTCFAYAWIERRNSKMLRHWLVRGLFWFIVFNAIGFAALKCEKRNIAAKDTYRLGVVQPNIDFRYKLDSSQVYRLIKKQMELTKKLQKRDNPFVVFWPETAVPADVLKDDFFREEFRVFADTLKLKLVLGMTLYEHWKTFNSAVYLNERGEINPVYSKRYLVPFSEYLPAIQWLETLREKMDIYSFDFTPGRGRGVFYLGKENVPALRMGYAICSEDTVGHWFRAYKKRRIHALIVLLNDGWFVAPQALLLHAQNSIMRAVENRIYVLRVANTGLSCLIDPSGRWDRNAVKFLNKEGVMSFDLELKERVSFYSMTGDLFCYLCLIFVIIIFGKSILKFKI